MGTVLYVRDMILLGSTTNKAQFQLFFLLLLNIALTNDLCVMPGPTGSDHDAISVTVAVGMPSTTASPQEEPQPVAEPNQTNDTNGSSEAQLPSTASTTVAPAADPIPAASTRG